MKPFIINLGIYPFDVLVYCGEDRKPMFKELRKYLPDNNVDTFEEMEFRKGKTVMFPGGQTVIYLYRVPQDVSDLAILNHEIFHATCFIMDMVGMKFSEDSDEAYAYLIEYLSREIYKKLSIKF